MSQRPKHIPPSKEELLARLRTWAEGAAAQPTGDTPQADDDWDDDGDADTLDDEDALGRALALAPRAPAIRDPKRYLPRSSWTGPKQRLFIKTLAATGSVEQSAARVGMSVSSAYRLRLRPDATAFRSAWLRAIRSCVNAVRDVAYDRAINGEQKLIVRNGEVMGRFHSFDNKMIMWLLNTYDDQFAMKYHPADEARLVADLERLTDLPDEAEEAMVFDAIDAGE